MKENGGTMFSTRSVMDHTDQSKRLEVHLDVYSVVTPSAQRHAPRRQWTWEVAVIFDGNVLENYPRDNVLYSDTKAEALLDGRSCQDECVKVYTEHLSDNKVHSEVQSVDIPS